jgi:hypothetical protein
MQLGTLLPVSFERRDERSKLPSDATFNWLKNANIGLAHEVAQEKETGKLKIGDLNNRAPTLGQMFLDYLGHYLNHKIRFEVYKTQGSASA